jgi:hypothetical protein
MTAAAPAHQLSSLVLPDDGRLRREPSRPLERRDGSFDALTLFYDAFRHPVDGTVLLVGPELRNLHAAVEQMEVTSTADGRRGTLNVIDQNRLARVTLAGLDGAERLRIAVVPGHSRDLAVQPNHADLFAGLRLLMTASKDNDLDWIAEWARFHRNAHGAEAVLFYDNGSSRYRLGDIAETLTRGLAAGSWSLPGRSSGGRWVCPTGSATGTPTIANTASSTMRAGAISPGRTAS